MKNPVRKFYLFLDEPLIPWTRLALIVLCIPLAYSVMLPLWRISMEAPQYPKGLYLDIFAYKIAGGDDGAHLQEINTLNHYIGMRPLVPEAFPDLGWMPFALAALLVLTLRVAVIGDVRMLVDLTVMAGYLFAVFGARFVYMLYVFGHELDPRAPVTVEPFTPAIFGTKQIANFTTHSMPQLGTYLVLTFAVGVGAIAVWHLISGRRSAERAEADAAGKRTRSSLFPEA